MDGYSYKVAKEFKRLFKQSTGIDVSLKQFVKFCKLYTKKKNVDFFNVDYEGLYPFILNRTDIPLH